MKKKICQAQEYNLEIFENKTEKKWMKEGLIYYVNY